MRAERRRQVEVGGLHRDAARLAGVDEAVAPHRRAAHGVDGGRRAARRRRAAMRARAVFGSLDSSPKNDSPAWSGEEVRAEAVDRREQLGLAGRRDAEHGDHRGDPDRDPDGRQRGAQPARAQADASRRRGRRGAAGGWARARGRRRAARARVAGGHPRRSSPTISPSRSSTRRGNAAATCGSCVMTTSVVPALVELAQQRDDRGAGLRVQRAGRLVGEDDRGLGDERARDRRALPLAAGELGRVVVEAMAEADALERLARALAPLRARHAGVEQAAGDVVDGRQPVEQVELLEDEAHAARPQRRQLVVGGGGGVEAVDGHLAGGRAVERAHDLQQRRLARARRPEDRDELAGRDLEVDAAQRAHAAGVLLRDAAQAQDGRAAAAARASRSGRSPGGAWRAGRSPAGRPPGGASPPGRPSGARSPSGWSPSAASSDRRVRDAHAGPQARRPRSRPSRS